MNMCFVQTERVCLLGTTVAHYKKKMACNHNPMLSHTNQDQFCFVPVILDIDEDFHEDIIAFNKISHCYLILKNQENLVKHY